MRAVTRSMPSAFSTSRSRHGDLDGLSHVGDAPLNQFLTKYDGSGTHVWTHLLASDDTGNPIIASAPAALYVVGETAELDIYVVKYDPDGVEQ
jgi:hypothetical protein